MKVPIVIPAGATHILLKVGRAKTQLWARPPGAVMAEKDGELSADVTMEIDLARLLREYAGKAVKNKKGKSRMLSGCIVFQVVRGSERKSPQV